MPNEVPTWEETEDIAPTWEDTTPHVQLSPYEQLRMQGLGGGIGATSGPPHPEEVLTIPESLAEPPFRIPRIQATSTIGKILAAPVNVGSGALEAIGSPLGLAALSVGGTELGAPIIKGIFGGLAAKGAGETLGQASVTGDVGQFSEGALQAALAGGITLPGSLSSPSRELAGQLGEQAQLPIISRAREEAIAQTGGAPIERIARPIANPPPLVRTAPPGPETVSPEAAAEAAKRMSREATASFEPAPLPKAQVPEGPSDPRVAEAREAGADTIPKVLKLFPEMKGNRESARDIVKQAFPPEEVSPAPAAPTPAAVPFPPSAEAQVPLPAELQRALEKQQAAVAGGETGPYPAIEADAKKWRDTQAEFAEGAKVGKPDIPLWTANEAIKKKYSAEQAGPPPGEALPLRTETTPEPTVRGPATTADILGKVSSRLDSAADAARARLAAQRGGTTFGSGPLHELPNIRDYAIIGAAKIAKGATEFAKWSTEMVKDFGEAIKPHLDNIFRRAQEAFDEHASVVTRVNRILYEAELPRRAVAVAGKKAVGKAIESGVEAGKSLAKAEAEPKIQSLQEQLTDSIPKAQALREYFRGQEKGGAAGRKEATRELKLADRWLEADANRIRESLVKLVNESLPVSERGRFLKAVADATKRPPLIGGDPELMYQRAAQVAARVEDRAQEVRKSDLSNQIKDAVSKAVASPGVDIGYKKLILDAVRRITFQKPTGATVDTLKATRDYLNRQEAAGEDVTLPKEVVDELEVLGKVPARELPEHVLEAIRDKVQLLDQLGRLKVKARKAAWEIEKNNKTQQLSQEATNPLTERPEFRQQPGDPRPLSMKIRNWVNRQLNIGSLLDKALLPMDALFDLLGDAKGTYRGWLFKNVRNPLDLDFNAAEVARNAATAPLERIIKENNLGEQQSERIGVYAAALQEGGIDRLVEMGVKPETIDNILKTITPAEMEAYRAMRQEMDATLPEVQKLMHELYNIDVKPVPDYFPMPRDWNQYEPEPEAAKAPSYGKDMDFDELAGWKQMLGDFTSPKTTKTERGFTLERQKGAATPIKLNAFDVFQQHMNDVNYLLKTQRNLKMIGEMARSDLFAEKYGKVGQNIVLGWLDTVARQGKLGGFRRIPFLDELRRRTSAGVIGFRLASQFVHLSNIPLAVWRTGGPLWWKAGLGEALGERGQNFLKNNFAETYARGGGEPALVEASQSDLSAFGKTIVPKSVVRAGFAIARTIDQYNAQATTLGTYLRLISEKGLDAKNYDKIPVDKEAQAQALVLARRAVASPLPKDVSASLARGAITGGNVSLGRTILQFQNIFQDQWSNIRHDLVRAGIIEKNPKLAATAFVALAATLLSEMGIREVSKQTISSVTGYKPTKEPSTESRIALEAARRIPFGGQLTSELMYGETGIPIIDSFVDVTKAAKTTATAKKDVTRQKALTRAVAGAAQLGGVPGASQVGELLQKAQ